MQPARLGVDFRIAAETQDFLVTVTLTLFDEVRADPPDEWMKPEDRFNQHADSGCEIVAAAEPGQIC